MFKRIKFGSIFGNPWVLLVIAVIIAASLTYLTYQYLVGREARLKESLAKQKPPGVEVVVPVRDVPEGTPLSAGVFAAREIPMDLVYDDMVRAADFSELEASRTVKPVRKGLPLRRGDVEALRARDFSDKLPPGQRAVTLEIDTVNSTARMVKPGDRVDLYWVGKPQLMPGTGSKDDQRMIRLLLPNVLILAVGQDIRPRDAGEALDNADGRKRQDFDTVTVQIAVDEAPRVALAQKIGGLRMLLRNAEEKGFSIPPGLTETNLFAQGKMEADRSVEIIAGGQTTQTVLVPVESGDAPKVRTPTGAGVAAASAPQALPSTSLVDQANAIAKQLQSHAAAGLN